MKNINKKFLILAAILIIFYLVLMVIIFSNSQNNNVPSKTITKPTPTLVEIQQQPNKNPGQNNSVELSPQDIVATRKERSIGDLLLKLPHKGVFFELSYEYETDSFNLILDSNNPQQANSDLETFLKPLGLVKEDLQNLFVSSK